MERTTMGITLHWICAWYTVNRDYYLTIILFRLPYIPNTHVSFIRFHCSLCFWPFTIFGTIGGRIRRLWTVLCKLLRRDGYSVDSWSESYGKLQSQKLCLFSCHRFLSLGNWVAYSLHAWPNLSPWRQPPGSDFRASFYFSGPHLELVFSCLLNHM